MTWSARSGCWTGTLLPLVVVLAGGCGGDASGAGDDPGCPGCVAPGATGGAAMPSSGAGSPSASGAGADAAGAGGGSAGAGTAGAGAGGGSAADGGAGAMGGAGASGAAGLAGVAGGAGAAGAGAGGQGGACVAAWTCGAWSGLPDGRFERSCQDDNACGDDTTRPPEGPVALPALDEPFYRCNVQPIFDWGCAMLGCHGTETGRAFRHYAPARLRNDETVTRVTSCLPPTGTVNLQERASGTVMCEGRLPHTAAEIAKNFDNARGFMLGLTDPAESELLAQPVMGGKAHAGVHLYREGDARYQAIYDWLAGARLTSCD